MFRPINEMSKEERELELIEVKKLLEISANVNVESLLTQKTNLDVLKKYNLTVTPNGQLFSVVEQGAFPEIMETMYEDRKQYKNLAIEAKKKLELVKEDAVQTQYYVNQIARYNNMQLAKKVTLNSAYGSLGNQYFRFYDTRIATAITSAGQLSIKWIEQQINCYMNNLLKTKDVDYVIASDTDSIVLTLDAIVTKVYPKDVDTKKVINFMDKVCKEKLQPFIDAAYQDLADYVNAYQQKMRMKRESLADKAIWTAKKRYILNVYDSEGVAYAKPKLKIMGLEAIKSSTPSSCRQKIKQCIEIILNKDEEFLQNFIEEFKQEFKKLPVEDIAFPRSVNGLSEYADTASIYRKGTPIHVKGALVYNHLLKSMHLDKKFPLIQEGEKIKFVYLKLPNPYNNNTLAFISTIPKQLETDNWIDYDLQFQKAFIEPMGMILSSINWRSEKISSLEDLFA